MNTAAQLGLLAAWALAVLERPQEFLSGRWLKTGIWLVSSWRGQLGEARYQAEGPVPLPAATPRKAGECAGSHHVEPGS